MFRLLVALIAAITIVIPTAPSKPIVDAQNSTVQLIGTVAESIQETRQSHYVRHTLLCSGFVGAMGIIITARHCVYPHTEGTEYGTLVVKPFITLVKFKDGSSAKPLRITHDKDADIAQIYVDDIKHTPVDFEDHVYQGEQIFVYGAPGGNEWVYSNGYISQGQIPVVGQGDPQFSWNGTYMIDCPSCYGGDSGGPVFNMDGKVVGMMVALDGAPEEGLMEPASFIMKDIYNESR